MDCSRFLKSKITGVETKFEVRTHFSVPIKSKRSMLGIMVRTHLTVPIRSKGNLLRTIVICYGIL